MTDYRQQFLSRRHQQQAQFCTGASNEALTRGQGTLKQLLSGTKHIPESPGGVDGCGFPCTPVKAHDYVRVAHPVFTRVTGFHVKILPDGQVALSPEMAPSPPNAALRVLMSLKAAAPVDMKVKIVPAPEKPESRMLLIPNVYAFHALAENAVQKLGSETSLSM